MSSNSSTSEEQQKLPEVFRRLGKTVPPRERRSYSGSQSPQDSGFRFVRPFQANQPHYPPPNDLHHANYNSMVIQASTPSPPLYYRPQMNSKDNTMGFRTSFSPNGNNNNNKMPNPYHSPTSSTVSSSTPPPLHPSPSSPLPPQNGFSFIPKDTHPNPNPIISFVRNPNAGAYSAPYQFFSNSNLNQVSMNNGQQVLHPPPPAAAFASVSNVATASASASSTPPPVSRNTSTGASTVLPSSTNAKEDGTASSSSDNKTFSPTTPSSSKSEQKKPQKPVPNDHSGSSDEKEKEAPIHQRDILAKSIKIIASRPLGSTDKPPSRKHPRHNDSEASDESDEDIIVTRKIVVASDDIDLDRQSNERDSSPIQKKPRRLNSPTIPRRTTSLSEESDDGDFRITKRYTTRSPSPMSGDRRTYSRSRSRSVSRSRSYHHRRSLSSSRSRSRARSRSRSRSPSRQTKRRRRSVSFTRQYRDHSPGSSSDEELAPFLRNEADRYVPDYNRRPLPPQRRRRSPPARKLSSPSTAETIIGKKSSSSSSPSLAKKSASTDSNKSINGQLNQNKPKELRSYPPLGTSPSSFNTSRSRAEAETSSPSKQPLVKKANPIISHKIITKPSPGVAKAKDISTAASTAKKSASPAAKTAQSTTQSSGIKPHSTNNTDNDTNLMPIKQEIITEQIIEQSKSVDKSNGMRNANVMAGIETPSQQTTPTLSKDGSTSAALEHASPDTTLSKPTAVHASKVTVATEATTLHQQRKHRVFSDTPIANAAKTNTNASSSSVMPFVKPLVNGTPTAPTTVHTASTTPTSTINGSSQPTKRVTITPEARAAIKQRAAKEQERLDQERLRQLDIDDRDDVVMDIAFPTSQSRSPAVKIANKNPVINASEDQTNKSTELIQTTNVTAESTNNHSNMTSSFSNRNSGSALMNDEQVTPLVNHPTSVLNMTGPENVPSPDTTSTAGINSAFTNLVTSSDNMSVPDGNTKGQTELMPVQTIPPASSSSTLESPIAHVSIAVAAAAITTKSAVKKSSRRRLPTPWKVKMNDSGDIYYHNPVTGEETFVRPE